MSIKRNPSRRPDARKSRKSVPARQVREILLELAYQLHATRVVKYVPRDAGSVA